MMAVPARRQHSRFQSLAITHAVMTAGEASMVLALADSFFFDVDLDGQRSRLLAFLLVGFAPFLMVNAKLGPMIDRPRWATGDGGRPCNLSCRGADRHDFTADGIALFPFVFAALVLQKTYAVTKQAIVPSVVRNASDLVKQTQNLAVLHADRSICGCAGGWHPAVARNGSTLFTERCSLSQQRSLPRLPQAHANRSASEPLTERGVKSSDVHVGWIAMTVLRFAQGFTLFQVALWFRSSAASPLWLAAAVGLGALAPFVGNTVGPWLRQKTEVEKMLAAALALPAIAAGGAVFVGGTWLVSCFLWWSTFLGASADWHSNQSSSAMWQSEVEQRHLRGLRHDSNSDGWPAQRCPFSLRCQERWASLILRPFSLRRSCRTLPVLGR